MSTSKDPLVSRRVRLRDVVLAVRDDEAGHRDVNHRFADSLAGRDGSEPEGDAERGKHR